MSEENPHALPEGAANSHRVTFVTVEEVRMSWSELASGPILRDVFRLPASWLARQTALVDAFRKSGWPQ